MTKPMRTGPPARRREAHRPLRRWAKRLRAAAPGTRSGRAAVHGRASRRWTESAGWRDPVDAARDVDQLDVAGTADRTGRVRRCRRPATRAVAALAAFCVVRHGGVA